MKVEIYGTDTCQPCYFNGSSKPYVWIEHHETGYTSRELREEIIRAFEHRYFGGRDKILDSFGLDEEEQRLADEFYEKSLKACLNREIKYRGKKLKCNEETEGICTYIVFDIIY